MFRVAPLPNMIAYSLLGNSAMAAQPVIVGALVDQLGLTERLAGFVSAGEMGGFAIGMAVMYGTVGHIERRVIATAAVVGMVVANVFSIFSPRFETILAARLASGMAAAAAYSVFLTLAAASERPERSFAISNAVSLAFTGSFVWVGPYLVAMWGLRGIFLCITALALAVGILFRPGLHRRAASSKVIAASSKSAIEARAPVAIVLVLFTMLFLYSGHGAIWSYQERIGVDMGLSPKNVGILIGSSMIVWGSLGSMIASLSGLKLGRIIPQIISLGLSIIAALILVLTRTSIGFGLASALIALSWFYGLPYQMGLLAQFDPQGRANVAGSLMTTGGAALGPGVAALLLGYRGHLGIGVLAAGCYFIALATVIPASIRAKMHHGNRMPT